MFSGRRIKYGVLGSNPRFQRMKAFCPQLATWDNHDYGYGRVGAEHPRKRESQKEFLDFWKIPVADPRRQRDGIYHAHVFGTFPQAIQVIMLDCRFFKTQTEAEAGGTILGAAQWAWLAEQFKVPASLRIVCSSIQVLGPDTTRRTSGSSRWIGI
jgi:alkaline phosphatase D